MKPSGLKFKTLLFTFLFFSFSLSAKEIHFITNDIFGLVGYIRIYEGEKKIAQITKDEVVILKVNDDVSRMSLTFKWGLRLNKKLELDFGNREYVFVYINLDPAIWSVYDSDDPAIPPTIAKMYIEEKEAIELSIRIKKHQNTGMNSDRLKFYLQNPKSVQEGIYKGAIKKSYSSDADIAVVKSEDGYTLIYMGGGNEKIWKEGDLKATLTKTANENIYLAAWYLDNKKLEKSFFITFEEATMKIIGPNGNPEQIFVKHYPQASTTIRNEAPTGTGFALSGNGLIVTSYQLIKEAAGIRIKGINGDFSIAYNAKVLASDKNNDLAIIQIDDAGFKGVGSIPYVLKPTTSDIGENVFALAYPLKASIADELTLINGMVSSKVGFQGDITSYQISAATQPGNNGAPLFDKSGNLIGVIKVKPSGSGNESYALKINYLKNIIEALPTSVKLNEVNALNSLSLADQVKTLNKFIYIVEIK